MRKPSRPIALLNLSALQRRFVAAMTSLSFLISSASPVLAAVPELLRKPKPSGPRPPAKVYQIDRNANPSNMRQRFHDFVVETTRPAQAAYCAINNNGGAFIRPDYLSLDPAYIEEHKQVLEKLTELSRQGNKIKEQHLTRTGVISSSANLRQEFLQIRSRIEALAPHFESTRRAAAQTMLDGFYQLAKLLALLDTLESPKLASLDKIRADFSLKLSLATFDVIYPMGIGFPKGMEVRPLDLDKETMGYSIELSGQSAFRILMRAAAQSQNTRADQTAYMETVRCGLNYMIVGKIKINQAILGQEKNSIVLIDPSGREQTLNPEQLACLNTRVDDFIEVAQKDVDLRKENSLRQVIMDELPGVYRGEFSKETTAILATTMTKPYFPLARAIPEELDTINAQSLLHGLKMISRPQFNTVVTEINSRIEEEMARSQQLQALRGLWMTKPLRELFQRSIFGCQYNFVSRDKKSYSPDILFAKLAAAEDYYFLENVSTNLTTLLPRLSEMSKDQISQVLRQYIEREKRVAVAMAFETVLSHFDSPITPDLDQLIAAMTPDLVATVGELTQERWADGKIDQYLETIVLQASKKADDAKSLQLLLKDFASTMVGAAKQIEKFLDPKTPRYELPYNLSAILAGLGSLTSQLSPAKKPIATLLVSEQDPSEMKKAWAMIKSQLDAEATKLGVNSSGLSWKSALSFFDKSSGPRKVFESDRHILTVLAGALGLDREKPHDRFTDVYAYLIETLDSDDVDKFVELYRQDLTQDLFGQFRLLEASFDTKKKEFVKDGGEMFYKTLAQVAPAKAPAKGWDEASLQSVLPYVRAGVQLSLIPLQKHLQTVLHSQKPADLDFFIKRTRLINTLLGEDLVPKVQSSINGATALGIVKEDMMSDIAHHTGRFVFPDLVERHKYLQATMTAKEGLNKEIFDEVLQANINIGWMIIGGWALKHVFGRLPGWLGGRIVPAALQKAGDRLTPFMNGQSWYITGLIGVSVTYGFVVKSDLRTELQHITDLTRSETLDSSTADASLPLIGWSEYKQQRDYYAQAISDETSNQIQSLFWLAFPFAMGYGTKVGGRVTEKFRSKQNARYDNLSHSERLAFEEKALIQLGRERKFMNGYFRTLRLNEKAFGSLDPDTLRNAWAAARANGRKIDEIDEAYYEIVKRFGEQVAKYRNQPVLLESYSKAMFGPNGSTHQATALFDDYIRIVNEMMRGHL